MLVKQNSCRLNNTESFPYTVSCYVDIVECIIWKEIPPNKHANFCLLSLFFFALNIHRVHIQAFDDVLLHQCFKLYLKTKTTFTYFP